MIDKFGYPRAPKQLLKPFLRSFIGVALSTDDADITVIVGPDRKTVSISARMGLEMVGMVEMVVGWLDEGSVS